MAARGIGWFLLVACLAFVACEKKMVCYYGSWATYRHGNGKYEVKDLNPNVCSHLVYSFVGINADGTIRIMDPWLELPDNWGKDNFGEFNRLKSINPQLKTIVAVGGWNEGSAKFSKVANDPSLRAKFARNAAEFTVKYGFDGLDMDWEYPGQRDSPNKQQDKNAYTLLLKEMRSQFDQRKLLLTAAVAATQSSASLSYDIPAISKYLDFINIMAYDFHGAWDRVTGHNAALKRYENYTAGEVFNVESVVEYWLAQGAPAEKLVLGMPLYGRSFRLTDPKQNGVGAPTSGAGLAGQYTNEAGMIGYNELCEKRLTQSWPEIWDERAVVPYTYDTNNWITYDTAESLTRKVHYLLSKGLAGAMVWSIETDDFKNVCGRGAYPLLKAINAALGRTPPISGTTTTPDVTGTTVPNTNPTTTIGTTTKAPPNSTATCKEKGYMRDQIKCEVFYYCLPDGNGSFIKYDFVCPKGTVFDTVLNVCDYPFNVNCD